MDEEKLSKEYVQELLEKTEKALQSLQLAKRGGYAVLEMAQHYLSDAKFFFQRNELVNALGACEYAHGLLDSLVGLGYAKITKNQDLFVFGKA